MLAGQYAGKAGEAVGAQQPRTVVLDGRRPPVQRALPQRGLALFAVVYVLTVCCRYALRTARAAASQDFFLFRNHLCLAFELLNLNLYELIRHNKFRGLSLPLVRVFTAQVRRVAGRAGVGWGALPQERPALFGEPSQTHQAWA